MKRAIKIVVVVFVILLLVKGCDTALSDENKHITFIAIGLLFIFITGYRLVTLKKESINTTKKTIIKRASGNLFGGVVIALVISAGFYSDYDIAKNGIKTTATVTNVRSTVCGAKKTKSECYRVQYITNEGYVYHRDRSVKSSIKVGDMKKITHNINPIIPNWFANDVKDGWIDKPAMDYALDNNPSLIYPLWLSLTLIIFAIRWLSVLKYGKPNLVAKINK